jgi:hypothetical protein
MGPRGKRTEQLTRTLKNKYKEKRVRMNLRRLRVVALIKVIIPCLVSTFLHLSQYLYLEPIN